MIHNRFDFDNMIFYSSHTDHISPKSELVKIYDDEQMVERMFVTGKEFQRLQLSATELLLTLAVIITFPGSFFLSSLSLPTMPLDALPAIPLEGQRFRQGFLIVISLTEVPAKSKFGEVKCLCLL